MSDRLTVITGDCLVEMRKLPAESVHLIVTSPPYWGLRDYGIPPAIWGGDEACEHKWVEHIQPAANGICHDAGMTGETLSGNSATRKPKRSGFCSRCNAWRGVFGLEPTPELYIEHLTLIMREAKRVLRKDGTLWVNLGDSYATGAGSARSPGGNCFGKQNAVVDSGNFPKSQANRMPIAGLKPGDLVGIPWRAVFALQQPYYTGRIKSEADRVWLAAMLDAEGCLFIHKRKTGQNNGQGYRRKNDNYGTGIEISNTHESIVRRCQQIAGIGSICTQTEGRRQKLFRWNVRTTECLELIRELYPHLIAKKHQARIAFGCPPSGNLAAAAHQALIDLHRGKSVKLDFPAPPHCFEPGFYHRRDNIWFKSNPMPESVNGWRWERHRINVSAACRPRQQFHHSEGREISVPVDQQAQSEYKDCPGCAKCTPNGGLVLRKGNWRCTTSHEYVFQFSKSDSYFCNAEAAREDGMERPSGNKKRFIAKKDGDRGRINNHLGSAIPYCPNGSGRNLRSVWRISTKPYREAHFATFPPDLVRPIIAAASPEQCCGQCGAPYAPVIVRGEPRLEQQLACGSDDAGEYNGKATKDFLTGGAEDASAVKARILAGMVEKRVTGHRPTCLCGAISAPAVVLDPFGGSGTTGMVALELGRHAILIELNASYVKLIERRCQVTPGLGV